MWSITHDSTLLALCFLPLVCSCGTGRHFWDQSLSPCWVTSEASALLFLPHLLNCFQPLQSAAMNFKKKNLPDFIIVLLRKSWAAPVEHRGLLPAHSQGPYSNSVTFFSLPQRTWLGSSETFLLLKPLRTEENRQVSLEIYPNEFSTSVP